MIGFDELTKAPAWLSTGTLKVLTVATVSIRWLTSTLNGALTISVAAYAYLYYFGVSQPLGWGELITWFFGLGIEAVSLISAAMLAIVGFYITFDSAHENWLLQRRIELRIEMAKELEEFFNEASGLLIKLGIFANSTVSLWTHVSDNGLDDEAVSKADYLVTQIPGARHTRTRLSEMSVEVHRLRGKNLMLLSSHWGAVDALDRVISNFSDACSKMWFPFPDSSHETYGPTLALFLRIDPLKTQSFMDWGDDQFGAMNAELGRLRGQLLAPISRASTATIFFMFKNTDELGDALKALGDSGNARAQSQNSNSRKSSIL